VRQARETVRFAQGVRWLDEQGVTALVEVGPDGVLAALAEQGCSPGAVAVPVLRHGQAEHDTVLAALARLYVHGVPSTGRRCSPERGTAGGPADVCLPASAVLAAADLTAPGARRHQHPVHRSASACPPDRFAIRRVPRGPRNRRRGGGRPARLAPADVPADDFRRHLGGLAEQLAGMSAAERDRFLLDLVRGNAAVVLGHASGKQIGSDQPFKSWGSTR
jgi:hypothetical protein